MPPRKKTPPPAAMPQPPSSSIPPALVPDRAEEVKALEQAYAEALAENEKLREHADRRPSVSFGIGQLRCTYYLPFGHPLIAAMDAKVSTMIEPDTDGDPTQSFERWAADAAPPGPPIPGPTPTAPAPEPSAIPGPPIPGPVAAPMPVPSAPAPAPVAAPEQEGESYSLPCHSCGTTQLRGIQGANGTFYVCPSCPSETKAGFNLIVSAKTYWEKRYAASVCPQTGGALKFREGKDGKPDFMACADYKAKGCKYTMALPRLVAHVI